MPAANATTGSGPLHTIGLAEAREQARKCRQLLLQGLDPITVGKAARAAVKLTEANTRTFQQCAEAYHAAHCASWSNQKHAREWLASLATHAFPAIGGLPVAAVDTSEVLRVLEPAWIAIPETASRLRHRIEAVLDWAKVRGYRSGENPARWRGHLDHILPARKKLASVKHHAALPYRELSDFMPRLRARDEIEARALEFVILTAARAGELVGADWREIAIEPGDVWTWTVPASRMKMRRKHRVPLSEAARAVLEQGSDRPATGADLPRRHGASVVEVLTRVDRRCHGARLSQHVPRLGRGADDHPARDRGNGAGSPRRRRHRRSLPPHRPA